MAILNAKQRQFLKGLAHPLQPVVRIGKAGLTPGIVAETRKSLEAHELIKVRIEMEEAADRKAAAEELARETEANLAATIGKLAILYRQREEGPAIKLPK
jgi:RNA-binding protein